ncbi:uncharacterized protein LOC124263310 [Haliotis rubra]|uniref:uncharacterized protein LOC124263310 n=1 Tax=Haliotis rubra TaxID=36100 RepID=UPI001EE5660B|nr:uncharacterized protein LOC124263310 [Haliotis rubra]
MKMTTKRISKSKNNRGGKQKGLQDTVLTGVKGDDANIDHSVVMGANLGTVNFTSAIVPTDADLQPINDLTEGMVETETFVWIVKAIENGQKLFVITGEPGEGKTTFGFLILREMNQKGKTFCLVTSPENYKQRKNCDLLMFDDTFGSIAFEDKKYSDWEDTIIDVLALPEHKGSHSGTNIILIILRKTILAHLKTKLGRYANVFDDREILIDLTTTHRLTESEKRKVLEIHLDRNDMHENEGDIHFVCSSTFTYGFPQCCRMYADKVKVNIRGIFDRPLEFLDKETKWLLKKNKHNREVLQIMICDETFQPDKEADDEKRQTLIAATNDIFYLRQEGGCFHFAHSSYQESVGITIGIEDPRFLITRCSMPCIKKYMDASTATGRALFSQLTDELKDQLLSKIAKEFGRGDYDFMKYDLLHNKENLINVLNSECCAVDTKDVQLKPMQSRPEIFLL